MQAEILLTLKLHDRLFADPRRITLLKQVMACGSISQGAKLAGISYKSAWDAINEMNQLAPKVIVERVTGGRGGGGAVVTPFGSRLLQLYDLLGQIQQKAFDVLSDDALPLNSLLAAIARFSLQTSARNQLFGTVVKRHHEEVQQHIEVLLADGRQRLRAAVTAQSAERLELENGKEVLVLIKAPWIEVSRDPVKASGADNQLAGTLYTVARGSDRCELLIRLTDGQTLCATLPTTTVDEENLVEGAEVSAYFNADRVIIATLC